MTSAQITIAFSPERDVGTTIPRFAHDLFSPDLIHQLEVHITVDYRARAEDRSTVIDLGYIIFSNP
jgi:hypothetical protein